MPVAARREGEVTIRQDRWAARHARIDSSRLSNAGSWRLLVSGLTAMVRCATTGDLARHARGIVVATLAGFGWQYFGEFL